MTRDDIIELALQCGVWIPMAQGQEREQTIDRLQRLVGRAVAVEREECAIVAARTVCDEHIPTGIKIYGTRAAKAIRARGEK